MKMEWCIMNNDGDYWHNEYGWTDDDGLVSIYTTEEKEKYAWLPFGGHWEKY